MAERNEVSATTPKDGLLAATEAVAEQLNLGCFCISLDRKELGKALDRAVRIEGFAQRLSASHPTLSSNVPVFVPSATLGKMMLIVDAVEGAARLPAYRAATLSYAPQSASCASRWRLQTGHRFANIYSITPSSQSIDSVAKVVSESATAYGNTSVRPCNSEPQL